MLGKRNNVFVLKDPLRFMQFLKYGMILFYCMECVYFMYTQMTFLPRSMVKFKNKSVISLARLSSVASGFALHPTVQSIESKIELNFSGIKFN